MAISDHNSTTTRRREVGAPAFSLENVYVVGEPNFDKAFENIALLFAQPPDQTEEIDLSHLQLPLTRHEYFSMTDTWYQLVDFMLLCGYSALYFLNEFKDSAVKDIIVNDYTVGWNYIGLIARVFIHAYNIIEILRSERSKKRKLILETIGMFGSLTLAAGTTLSLLAYHHVLTGAVAVACAPLANFAPAFCALVLGCIELANMVKAKRKMNISYLFRRRIKAYARIKEKLEKAEVGSQTYAELENRRNVILSQVIAAARVGYYKGKISKRDMDAQLAEMNLQNDAHVNVRRVLMKNPSAQDKELIKYMMERQHAKVRQHAFSAAFWILVGVGVALAAASTFFFPPLLIPPALLVLALAAAFKAVELTEIDKRIYNCFASEKNKKTIDYDNPVTNFFARRNTESEIQKSFLVDHRGDLALVPNELSDGMRVKMRIAYEVSIEQYAKTRKGANGFSLSTEKLEKTFYTQVLKLSWWKRRKLLNNAMDAYIGKEALVNSRCANGLGPKEIEYYSKKYNRHGLFGGGKNSHLPNSLTRKTSSGRLERGAPPFRLPAIRG